MDFLILSLPFIFITDPPKIYKFNKMENNFYEKIIEYYQMLGRPLILDGAIGSYLEINYPQFENKFLWMSEINKEKSEILTNLYEDYLKNGADIITTNTFCTSPACFYRYLDDKQMDFYSKEILEKSEEYSKYAVNICKNLKIKYSNERKKVFIAGSNSPAENCYSAKRTFTSDQLKHNHKNHINFLIQNGCDFILNETLSNFDEIEIISKHCTDNNIPFSISLYMTDQLKLLSGERIEDIINHISYMYKPLFISVNCININIFNDFLKQIYNKNYSMEKKFNFAFYLNCGSYNFLNKIEKSILAEEMGIILENILEKTGEVFLIGTCCMSDPSYTKEIYSKLRNKQIK